MGAAEGISVRLRCIWLSLGSSEEVVEERRGGFGGGACGVTASTRSGSGGTVSVAPEIVQQRTHIIGADLVTSEYAGARVGESELGCEDVRCGHWVNTRIQS
jgi:hypothetical protein